MIRHFLMVASSALAVLFVLNGAVRAQTGYGVNSAQQLFRFDVNNPSVVTTIGPVSFLPEGIDFRPSTKTLYGIDVGAATTQLYTINVNSGVATAVGAGFPTTVAGAGGYNLGGSQTFGFDFNPTTLQADQSMRIRLVSTNGTNLRLNSSTGAVAVVDTPLLFGGSTPSVDGVAYINNIATMGGTTTLFDMDAGSDDLYTQNPPNAGTLNLVGDFGVTVDANAPIHFDIFTTPGSTDTTIGGDTGYAVLQRTGVPPTGPVPAGSYLLYKVNLSNGDITSGAAVGPAATPFNFAGGFAVNAIPEPTSMVLLVLGIATSAIGVRRRTS